MKLNKVILTFFVVGFALSNIAILYSLYNESLAPSSSSAATDGELFLKLESPANLSNVPNNSNMTLGLYARNTTGSTVGEFVLTFDPSVLQGTLIAEDSNLFLALNKKIDNSAGKITVDVAYSGGGDIPENVKLVGFDFKILDNSKNSSSVSVGSESTLGIPNTLGANGRGSLPINFGTSVQAQPICGNGVKEGAEQCDDGNLKSRDGCSSSCLIDSAVTPNNPTNSNSNPSTPENQVVDSENPVQTPEVSEIPEESVTPEIDTPATTTTTSSVKAVGNDPVDSATNNKTTLTVLLVLTISGTIASLGFLIRELFIKKAPQVNSNPFM